MISQRAARPSGSVERLNQLSLSNLKGVDESKAPTDPYSVVSAVNLVNNPDGSLSIRKPLLIARDWTRIVEKADPKVTRVLSVHKLYLEHHYLIIWETVLGSEVKCFTIYNVNTESFLDKLILFWEDYAGGSHSKTLKNVVAFPKQSHAVFVEDFVDLSSCTICNMATATVLGNCNVKLDSFIFEDNNGKHYLYDKTVYPSISNNTSVGAKNYFPRLLQLWYDTSTSAWCLRVHNPSVNRLVATESGYLHPMDTLLDNTYSLRDNYDATAPAILGILPYVYCENASVPTLTDYTAALKKYTKTTYPFRNVGQTKSVVGIGGFEISHSINLGEFELRVVLKMEVLESFAGPTLCAHHLTVFVVPSLDDRSIYNVNIGGHGSLHIKNSNGAKELSYSFDANPISELNPKDDSKVIPIYTLEHIFSSGIRPSPVVEFGFTFSNLNVSWDTLEPLENSASAPTVAQVTEQMGPVGFKGVSVLDKNYTGNCIIKAFCNFPKSSELNICATWLYTLDGITWNNVVNNTDFGYQDGTSTVANPNTYTNHIQVPNVSEQPIKGVDAEPQALDSVYYVPFSAESIKDPITSRIDVLKLSKKFFENPFTNATFRFKIVLVKQYATEGGTTAYDIVATYAQEDFTIPKGDSSEVMYIASKNAAAGAKYRYKNRILSFGDPSFEGYVYGTDAGELKAPFANVIDSNSVINGSVTAMTAWRDRLILCTPSTVGAATVTQDGIFTELVNTSVGVPLEDSKCVVSSLNGIVFKSGRKVYSLYPNVYSGDGSLNLTEMSVPISSHLLELNPHSTAHSFAFNANNKYVVMVPELDCTKCFTYDYVSKVWNILNFPIVFEHYEKHGVDEITLFGRPSDTESHYCEYYFEKSFEEAYGTPLPNVYGDILSESEYGISKDVMSYVLGDASSVSISPIPFELDTGQKSDQILTKKQFVETKIVVATDDHSPAIDMDCMIHIGGNASVITKDISTDSAFWKKEAGGATLNTSGTGLGGADAKKVLRQLVLRYSGKGNSIRHIITGQSLSNFSLYETYVRYKLLNVKQ